MMLTRERLRMRLNKEFPKFYHKIVVTQNYWLLKDKHIHCFIKGDSSNYDEEFMQLQSYCFNKLRAHKPRIIRYAGRPKRIKLDIFDNM